MKWIIAIIAGGIMRHGILDSDAIDWVKTGYSIASIVLCLFVALGIVYFTTRD